MEDTAARHVNLAALAVILIGGAAAMFVWRLLGGGSIKVALALLTAAVVVMAIDAGLNGPDATVERAQSIMGVLINAIESALGGLGQAVSAVLVGAVKLTMLVIEALFRFVAGAVGAFGAGGSAKAEVSPPPEVNAGVKQMPDVEAARARADAEAWAAAQALANLTAQAQAEGLAQAAAAPAVQPQSWTINQMPMPARVTNKQAPAFGVEVNGMIYQDAEGRTYAEQADGTLVEVEIDRPEDHGMGIGISNPVASAPIEAKYGAIRGPSVSVLSMFGIK